MDSKLKTLISSQFRITGVMLLSEKTYAIFIPGDPKNTGIYSAKVADLEGKSGCELCSFNNDLCEGIHWAWVTKKFRKDRVNFLCLAIAKYGFKGRRHWHFTTKIKGSLFVVSYIKLKSIYEGDKR